MSKSNKELQAELEQSRARFAAMQRKLQSKKAQAGKMQAHAEQQLKQLQAQAPGSRRDRMIELYSLRRLLALKHQAMLQILGAYDPMVPGAAGYMQQNKPKLDALDADMKYIALEYAVRNYRPIIETIEQVTGVSPAAPATERPAAPRPATGRLPASPQPGARPATGPLSQRSGNTGMLGANRPAAQRAGTGPLSARAATGALAANRQAVETSGEEAAPLEQVSPAMLAALQQAASQTDSRPKLDLLRQQFREIESSLGALQGEELGSLSSPSDAALISKIAGQIYYLKRTIDSLPELAAWLVFEPNESDAALQQFMAQRQMDAATPAEGAQLTGKLKSLFNR